eukprot:298507-Rhodomonas_salina.1
MHPYARPDQNSSPHMLFTCNHVTGTENQCQELEKNIPTEPEVRNPTIESLVIPENALSQDQVQDSQELTDARISSGENEATEENSTSRKQSGPEDEEEERAGRHDGFREDKRRARPDGESNSCPSQP